MIARVALLLALLAPQVSAQQDSLFFPSDRDANAQLATIVTAARDAGLPIDPILGKVRYGILVVHAQPQRIVGAARALAARLQVARDALMPGPTAGDIATGADALEYGATKDQLKAIRVASGDQPVSTPLGVLAQLVASGVDAKRATTIVTDLIKKHATPAQLVALGTDVNADVANGAKATAALDIRLRGLTAVLAPPGGVGAATGDGLSATTPKKKP
jgi:hypothetical protein